MLVPPYPASIIFRTRDDGIAFVVERAREYLVGVALQLLQ